MSQIFDKIIPPNRFVGLHAHSGFSSFDGLGYPSQHIDFVTSESQGMDAWALTDHGNGNGLAHARSHTAKLQKKGKKYRQIYGVEFYFVPSLDEWQIEMSAHNQSVQEAKIEKKKAKEEKTKTSAVVSELAGLADDDDDEQGGHVIEDEEESKFSRLNKPNWKKYYHLVINAKNRIGLSNLFMLVKKSYKHGFYRFPRIDYKMLKEHSEGLLVSSACIGGHLSGIIYDAFPTVAFDKLNPQLIEDPKNKTVYNNIVSKLENSVDRFIDCVGKENFFLELQFNKLPAQHLTNACLINLSEKTGVSLISTCDSHYPSPDKWQARELYKKLGWMGSKIDESSLPKFEDLKCELYPKNASQMWDEFKKGHEQYNFYHGKEELVKSSIERTHDLAWNVCEDIWIDISPKLPNFSTPERSSMRQLIDLVKQGLIKQNLANKPEYVSRVKEELEVVKAKKFEDYFLTLHAIFQKSSKRCLSGPARGSGSGSLINYLLEITHVDPIKYGLLFSRFINMGRKGFPDVDCDISDRNILIDEARKLFGDDAVIPVTNFNLLKTKSLIKDLSKIFGVPFEEVNELTITLQTDVEPHARGEDIEKSVYVLTHEDCMKYSEKYRIFMKKYPQVCEHIETLFSQNRSVGRHAGGVILADPDVIAANMPLIGVRGELQTPWTEGMNWRNLEDNGFLKFDFLGLTLLKDVEECIKRILKNKGNKNPTFDQVNTFFDENLNCRYHEPNDQNVFKHVFLGGRFTSVFQFTQSGARNFCMSAKPTTIDELAAITAIYRPGPLKANVHKKYVEAIESGVDDPIVEKHPVIKEVLGPTHGFLCLAGESLVMTDAGEITIKEIVENKMSYNLPSYNLITGEVVEDKIVQFYDHGEKETIIITTDDGEIELTPDHVVYTTRGKISAKDIQIDDEIICLNQ